MDSSEQLNQIKAPRRTQARACKELSTLVCGVALNKTRSAGFTPALRVCFCCFLMSAQSSDRQPPCQPEVALAFILVHRGRIRRIAPPELLQLLAAVPHTGRESGKIACARRGHFADRTANRAVEISLWNCIRKLSRLAPPSEKGEERAVPVSRFMAVSRSFT